MPYLPLTRWRHLAKDTNDKFSSCSLLLRLMFLKIVIFGFRLWVFCSMCWLWPVSHWLGVGPEALWRCIELAQSSIAVRAQLVTGPLRSKSLGCFAFFSFCYNLVFLGKQSSILPGECRPGWLECSGDVHCQFEPWESCVMFSASLPSRTDFGCSLPGAGSVTSSLHLLSKHYIVLSLCLCSCGLKQNGRLLRSDFLFSPSY